MGEGYYTTKCNPNPYVEKLMAEVPLKGLMVVPSCGSCLMKFYSTDGLVVVASSRSHLLFQGLCAPAFWYIYAVVLVCSGILYQVSFLFP